MSDEPKKPAEDPAKDWLAETFPEPEPWPEPRPPAPQPQAQEVRQLRHTRLGDGLRGAAALAGGLYVYDALTDDSDVDPAGEMDLGSGGA